MKRILVGMLVATVCCSASAMTLQTYRKLQQSAELAGSEASYRNLEVLTALKVGIAGTIESLRSSDGSIRVNGKSLICAPPSVPITGAIVGAGIKTAEQEQAKEGHPDGASQLGVAIVAIRGLVLMYPCAESGEPQTHG
jgi:hypothetical protein